MADTDTKEILHSSYENPRDKHFSSTSDRVLIRSLFHSSTLNEQEKMKI